MNSHFLMSACRCRRDHAHHDGCHYQVQWSLNPHTRVGEASIRSASAEHESLMNAICEMQGQVDLVNFVEGAYDSVFIKDAGIAFERGGSRFTFMGNAKHAERKLELERRAFDLEAMGFEIVAQSGGLFEGGDFVFLPKQKLAFLGYGQRSEAGSARDISQVLDLEVTPLELRDPYLYHLDLSLGALSDGTVFACRAAFSEESWNTLREKLSGSELIEVPREAAMGFDLNWVEVPGGVVHSIESRHVPALLRSRGWKTRPVSLSQFEAAGGSAACLVSRVWRF